RPTQRIDALGNSSSVSYDGAGKVLTSTDERSSVTANAYDYAGRLKYVQQPDPSSGSASSVFQTNFAFDNVGNLATTTDPNGGVTAYTYDSLNRKIKLTQPDPATGGTTSSSPITSYSYDPAGNLAAVIDPLNHATSYRYDALNRKIVQIEAD